MEGFKREGADDDNDLAEGACCGGDCASGSSWEEGLRV